jgi:hypothetical protein
MFPQIKKTKSPNQNLNQIKNDSNNNRKTLENIQIQIKLGNVTWSDQTYPLSLDQIYKSSIKRLQDLEENKSKFDCYYKINESCIFETLRNYIETLTNLSNLFGLAEMKSNNTARNIIKIINKYGISSNYTHEPELPTGKTAKDIYNHESDSDSDNENDYDYHKNVPDNPNNDNKKSKNNTEEETNTTATKPETDNNTKQLNNNNANSTNEAKTDESKNKPPAELSNSLEMLEKNFNFSYNNETESSAAPEEFEDNLDDFKEDLPVELRTLKKKSYKNPIITPLVASSRKRHIYLTKQNEIDADRLHQLLSHLDEATFDKYEKLLQEIESIVKIFEKYFLSFLLLKDQIIKKKTKNHNQHKSDMNNEDIIYERCMEVPTNYDKKRSFYIDFIRDTIFNLRKMREKFYNIDSEEGINLQDDMSVGSQKLCNRFFDAEILPIVFIIPEFTSQLGECVKYLYEWLDFDRSYVVFIQKDLTEIEAKQKNLLNTKLSQDKMFTFMINRINSLNELINNDQMNDLIQRKENHNLLLNDQSTDQNISAVYQELNELSINTIVKQLMAFRSENYLKYNCQEMLTRYNENLTEVENKLNRLIKSFRIDNNEKRKCTRCIKSFLSEYEKQIHVNYKNKSIEQTDIDLQEHCILKLKNIIVYKQSSQLLEKLFFNMPLTILKSGQGGTKVNLHMNIPDSYKVSALPTLPALTANIDQTGLFL